MRYAMRNKKIQSEASNLLGNYSGIEIGHLLLWGTTHPRGISAGCICTEEILFLFEINTVKYHENGTQNYK